MSSRLVGQLTSAEYARFCDEIQRFMYRTSADMLAMMSGGQLSLTDSIRYDQELRRRKQDSQRAGRAGKGHCRWDAAAIATTETELVAAVHAHAAAHYNEGGWDTIYECWDKDDILDFMKRNGCVTLEDFLREVKDVVDALRERGAW